MRKLSQIELISLCTALKMETTELNLGRGITALIKDGDLKKQAECGMVAGEGKIRSFQQFINENQIQ